MKKWMTITLIGSVLTVSAGAVAAYQMHQKKNQIATTSIDNFIERINVYEPSVEIFYDQVQTSLFNNEIVVDGVTVSLKVPELELSGMPAKAYNIDRILLDYSVDHSELATLEARSRFPEMTRVEIQGIELGLENDIKLAKGIAEAERDEEMLFMAKTVENLVKDEDEVRMDVLLHSFYDEKTERHENKINVSLHNIADLNTSFTLSGLEYNKEKGYISFEPMAVTVVNVKTGIETSKDIIEAATLAVTDLTGGDYVTVKADLDKELSYLTKEMEREGFNEYAPGLISAIQGYYEGRKALSIELNSKSEKGISPVEMFFQLAMMNSEEKAIMHFRNKVEMSFNGL